MKSGSHFEQLQSEQHMQPAAATGVGSEDHRGPARYGDRDLRGAGHKVSEEDSRNYALDKMSAFSGAAALNASGIPGFNNGPAMHPSYNDRGASSGLQPKGNLLESLFLAATSRLRSSEGEESSGRGGPLGTPLGAYGPSGEMLAAYRLGHMPPASGLPSAPHYDVGLPFPANHTAIDSSMGSLGQLSSAASSAGHHNRGPVAPNRPSLASLIDVARNKRSYDAALCDGMASSNSSTSSGVGSMGMAGQAWADTTPAASSAAAMLGLSSGLASSVDAGSMHMNDLVSGGLGGMSSSDVRVGLLPGVKLEDFKASKAPAKVDAQSRRSQREALSTLTAEEKLERRKERARMYSHIARKRQESNMRELKAEVESLSVYRLMIEEAPDMIAVLSPDIESRFLFANGAFARVLHVMPASILGSSIWTIIHEQDKPEVMKVLGSIIMATHAPGYVRCRVKCSYPETWLTVDISMRYGRQGIICFLRAAQPTT